MRIGRQRRRKPTSPPSTSIPRKEVRRPLFVPRRPSGRSFPGWPISLMPVPRRTSRVFAFSLLVDCLTGFSTATAATKYRSFTYGTHTAVRGKATRGSSPLSSTPGYRSASRSRPPAPTGNHSVTTWRLPIGKPGGQLHGKAPEPQAEEYRCTS